MMSLPAKPIELGYALEHLIEKATADEVQIRATYGHDHELTYRAESFKLALMDAHAAIERAVSLKAQRIGGVA